MGTKVRILVATLIAGVAYKPNQVVDLPTPLAKLHIANGEADKTPEAVAYCVNELGAEVIVHQTPPSPEQIQLQADIAELEAKLAEATDDAAKQALQAAINEKKALLG